MPQPGAAQPPATYNTPYPPEKPPHTLPPPGDKNDFLPELPSVPTGASMNPGGASAGGEDVDFDDLTKRFEELKKRK
jgi:vacuolar protein sorting-associated protein IST1